MKSTAKKAEKAAKTKTVNARPTCARHVGQERLEETATISSPSITPRYSMQLVPRVIRYKDAPGYLGMDRNRFNKEVRPDLVEFPIGKQGIGFDRLDLDAWFDAYKERNGRPGPHQRGDEPWHAKKHQDSSSEAVAGTSTKSSTGGEFAKALAQITSTKQKKSSHD
jgi:hypothetical protein